MDIFGKVLAVTPRDPFTTSDGRSIYATDVVISVPECRLSQMGGIYLKGRVFQCTLMSESANTSAPEVGRFVCAEISVNASYSQEKTMWFNRITLNKWVDMANVNWAWQ